MKTIRELCPKPSDAVQAMIDGLLNQSKRKDFQVDIKSSSNLQEIAENNFILSFEHNRAKFFDFDEFLQFESAIDWMRRGEVYGLLHFYGISDKKIQEVETSNELSDCKVLTANEWKAYLPAYQIFTDYLKSIGL